MATAQEKADLLRRNEEAAAFGLPPAPPTYVAPAAPAPLAEADGDLFDAALLDVPVARAEPYRMPGGKRVFVHPVSVEESVWLSALAGREVKKLGPLSDEEKVLQYRTRAQCYQVVLACRKGPEPGAARVFAPSDAEKLRRNPGYLEAIGEIVQLSDRLGMGDGWLQEELVDFFAVAASWLRTWCSRLNAETWPAAQADLEQFAGFAAAIAQHKRLDVGEWPVLDADPEVTEANAEAEVA